MESIKNTLSKVKSSKEWKFINDKAKAAVVGLDETKTAIIKSLNHEYRPPKEKHVQKILSIIQHPDTNMQEVVSLISTTMHKTSSWIVAIKGLQVFHRLIQEGNDRCVASILKMNPAKVIQMRDWKDPSPNSKAFVQTPFIRSYSNYLEQRVLLYKFASIKTLSPKYVYPNGLADTFKVLSNLQNCMDAILDCVLSEDLIDNASTLNAVSMILKDSMLSYKLLSDGIIKLLDQFFKMETGNAKEALTIYEKHLNQTHKLIEFYSCAKKLNGIIGNKLPSLTPPPDTFLKQMKKYVEDPKGYVSTSKDDQHDDIESQSIENLIGDDMDLMKKDLWEDEPAPVKQTSVKSSVKPKESNPFEESDPFGASDPFGTPTQNSDPFGGSTKDFDPFAEVPAPKKQQVVQPQYQPVYQQPIYPKVSSFDPNGLQPLQPVQPTRPQVNNQLNQNTQYISPYIQQQQQQQRQQQQPKKDDPFDFLSGITKDEKPKTEDPFATSDPFNNDPFF